MKNVTINTTLEDYLSFCLLSNIQPTYKNSVLFLKVLAIENKVPHKIPFKIYTRFKLKIKKKLETNNNRPFQITLKFANPN